jgi:subtilase family serine protease
MKIRSVAVGALFGATITALVPLSASAGMMEGKNLGPADNSEVAHFSVYLPLTHTDQLETLLQAQTDTTSSSYHQWLTPAQFKQQFGPSASDMARVKSMLQAQGFTVVAEHTQNIEVEGPVSAVEKTFNAHIEHMQLKSGAIKLAAAEKHLTLPASLVSVGAVIPEFAPHVAHVHSKLMPLKVPQVKTEDRLASAASLFFPNDLNEAYQLPAFDAEVTPLFSRKAVQTAGVGAHIGIVISSKISPADLASTFDSEIDIPGTPFADIQDYTGNTNLPVPTVKFREVNNGSGPFNPAADAAGEASLDTQMSLGTAPGAKETLYDIPDLSDDSVAAAYTAVVEDNIVDVVSSSFGECELDFTPAYNSGEDFTSILKLNHRIFQQGNAQGITFVASSGDSGGFDCLPAILSADNPPPQVPPPPVLSFVAGVNSPANDPNVTGVGGTNLQTAPIPTVNDATYLSENADFDALEPITGTVTDANGSVSPVTLINNTWGSGGGISTIWPKPLYQFLVQTGSNSHRTLPDVSLQMGGCPDGTVNDCSVLPRSSVIIFIGGGIATVIGTSASAPEIAGVLAIGIGVNGRMGNVNPLIYSLSLEQTLAGGTRAPKALQIFHRETSGSNAVFTVKPGQAYSEVLGNGTLDVKNFLELPFVAPAGTPSTPTNP